MLAVALVEEAVTLREAGIDAPVLLLTEAPPDGIGEFCAIGGTPTVYSEPGIALAAGAATRLGRPVAVHLKVDTGMHRVGADAAEVPALAGQRRRVGLAHPGRTLDALRGRRRPRRRLHRDADRPVRCRRRRGAGGRGEPGDAARRQLRRRDRAPAQPVRPRPLRHRLLRVRSLGAGRAGARRARSGRAEALRPALSLKARVHYVRRLSAGERTSYGRNYQLERDSLRRGRADRLCRRRATRRSGPAGGEVLVKGPPPAHRRHGDDGPAPRRLRCRGRRACRVTRSS